MASRTRRSLRRLALFRWVRRRPGGTATSCPAAGDRTRRCAECRWADSQGRKRWRRAPAAALASTRRARRRRSCRATTPPSQRARGSRSPLRRCPCPRARRVAQATSRSVCSTTPARAHDGRPATRGRRLARWAPSTEAAVKMPALRRAPRARRSAARRGRAPAGAADTTRLSHRARRWWAAACKATCGASQSLRQLKAAALGTRTRPQQGRPRRLTATRGRRRAGGWY